MPESVNNKIVPKCFSNFLSTLYLYPYMSMDSYFIQGYNLLSFILVLKLSQIWLVGVPSSWSLCPFGISSSFSEHFHAFRLIMYLPWNQPFHQESLFILAENDLRGRIPITTSIVISIYKPMSANSCALRKGTFLSLLLSYM